MNYKIRFIIHEILKFINRITGHKIWCKGEIPKVFKGK